MSRSPDAPQAASRSSLLAVAILIIAGYGLTLLVFYPGVMTYDAKFVYEDIAKHTLGDWQSPAMTVLWGLIDPIAPGSASMFLLIASFYWLGFGLLAFTLARRSVLAAILVPILALAPPAFAFVGMIWRDMLFSTTWLLAAVLVFAAIGRGEKLRLTAQGLAILLCAFGALLRPNAVTAAPILGAYIAWPMKVYWKRAAISFVPAMVLFFLLVQFVYYGVLGATRQHPLQSIMVFDLGGISHFMRENQYPVTWTPAETKLLLEGCYRPTEWDIYWRLAPCEFVMHKLEKDEKVFGTSTMTNAWISAIFHHPVAYLEHRAGFMWNFLTGSNLTMWLADVQRPDREVFLDRSAFVTLKHVHDVLKPTPLFRAGTWLVGCIVICGLAWRRRETAEGAFAVGLCGTAAVYVATFFAVGVASDFRYGYFAVLATIASGAALLVPMPRSARTAPR
jgi:hypothetical protein